MITDLNSCAIYMNLTLDTAKHGIKERIYSITDLNSCAIYMNLTLDTAKHGITSGFTRL